MFRTGYSILVGLALVGLIGCGKGSGDKGGGGSTPEDAFNKAVAAMKKEDIKEALAYVTSDSQKVITGAMVMMGATMKEFAKFLGGDSKELEDTLKKHGIDEAKVMEELKKLKGGPKMSSKEDMDNVKALAAHVSKEREFVHDMFQAMKKLNKDKDKDMATELKDASIADVKTDGDKATAKVTIGGEAKTVNFVRESGAWRIDLIPLILEKGKS